MRHRTHLVEHSYGAFVCVLLAMRDVRRVRFFDEGNRAGAIPAAEQKRDILYHKAVRFLRLEQNASRTRPKEE